MRRLLSHLSLLLLLAISLRAQTVRWEPAGGTLAINQQSDLTLIFDQCEPKGPVTLPPVAGLDFGTPSRSEQSSFSIINGSATHTTTVSLVYQVRPSTKQTITISAFQVATDKGTLRVAPATFEIGEATVGQSNLSLESIAQSYFNFPPDGVWAGEVFPLRYTLNVTRRYYYQLASDPNWNPDPLTLEPWDKPELLTATLNGEERVSVLYKTRAVAKTPGLYTLNTATQLVNLVTGTSAFSVFSRPNLEQFTVTSQPATLNVRALPLPAPADFTGAVGQFTLDSKIVPDTAAVGEPVTWTLTLAGTGNWPDLAGLPPRSVSKDFRVVQPQAKRVNKDGSLYDANLTEDIVLVPTKPGPYTLGPITLSYFDPKTGTYQTLKTAPVTITIAPGITPPSPANEKNSLSGTPVSQPSTLNSQPSPLPSTIPRDPLPSAAPTCAPLAASTLLSALLAALALPLVAWLALALLRARKTDPLLPQRNARLRIATTLAALRDANSPEQTAALLQQWQHDVAILWRLDLAVPTPESFLTGEQTSRSVPSEPWAILWSESERALYRIGTPLPADWPTRAHTALVAKRIPGFSAFQLFLPRNLLPLAIVIVSLVTGHWSLAAESGAASYSRADFSAAETFWTDALKTAPTDWTAHHNLSLTLVQQNRWPEAAGHALAAFVQQPQNPAVRWHLDFALRGAGLRPAEVMAFVDPDPLHALARVASPAVWQWTLLASVWLLAASLALWLWFAYARRHRLKPVAWTLFALALVVAVVSAASLSLYGPLADARVVFIAKPATLRSIPTELDAPQKSAPLTPGVLATTDKTFLGWQRLVFPNGQTGWVRTTDLVPLWH